MQRRAQRSTQLVVVVPFERSLAFRYFRSRSIESNFYRDFLQNSTILFGQILPEQRLLIFILMTSLRPVALRTRRCIYVGLIERFAGMPSSRNLEFTPKLANADLYLQMTLLGLQDSRMNLPTPSFHFYFAKLLHRIQIQISIAVFWAHNCAIFALSILSFSVFLYIGLSSSTEYTGLTWNPNFDSGNR